MLGCIASESSACSEVPGTAGVRSVVEFFNNKRVTQFPDCSFVNGDRYDNLAGDPSLDLGNGRTIQPIGSAQALVVDCASGESLILTGKVIATDSCGFGASRASFDEVFQSKGVLDWGAGANLSELAAIAVSKDLDASPDATKWVHGFLPRDRIDTYCGCKNFYPLSLGAKR